MYFTHDFFCGTTQNVLPNTGIPRNSGFGGGGNCVSDRIEWYVIFWMINFKGGGGMKQYLLLQKFPWENKKKTLKSL